MMILGMYKKNWKEKLGFQRVKSFWKFQLVMVKSTELNGNFIFYIRYSFVGNHVVNILRLHLGTNSDHIPFLRHNALFGPTIANPGSHVKWMNPPTRLLPFIAPLTGGNGLMHRFFNANMGDIISGSVSLSLFSKTCSYSSI